MNETELQAEHDRLCAGYTRALGLVVETCAPGHVVLSMPVGAELVHGGGVVCGQSLLAAADTAMLLAMIAQLGAFRPMTTVQLQMNFLRPVPKDAGRVAVECRIVRFGKTLSYGEVTFETGDGKLAAKATATYALL